MINVEFEIFKQMEWKRSLVSLSSSKFDVQRLKELQSD